MFFTLSGACWRCNSCVQAQSAALAAAAAAAAAGGGAKDSGRLTEFGQLRWQQI